jgi:hypothetical protein
MFFVRLAMVHSSRQLGGEVGSSRVLKAEPNVLVGNGFVERNAGSG